MDDIQSTNSTHQINQNKTSTKFKHNASSCIITPDKKTLLYILTVYQSDPTKLMLAIYLLNGHNYDEWYRLARRNLSARNKLAIVDGSIKIPARSDPIYRLWVRYKDLVISWLLDSIKPETRQVVEYYETTEQIWRDLQELFSQKDDSCVYWIRQ